MSGPILYRSIVDGWRVGVATDVANSSKVTVSDVETGLLETVTPAEIYIPTETSLLTAPHSFFTSDDDLAYLKPSPLESLPTLLHAIRCRFNEGKNGSLIGDNAFIYHSPSSERYSDVVHEEFGRRLTSSIRASPNIPQRLTVIGDRRSFDLFELLVSEVGSGVEGPSLLKEALRVIKPFVLTSTGESIGLISVDIYSSSRSAKINVDMLDFGVLETLHNGSGLSIFGCLLHGCSHDEKDEIFLPVTSFDFKAHPSTPKNVSVEACRMDFLQLKRSLDTIGVSADSQKGICGRASVALQLMDVIFDDNGTILNATAIKNAARLLRIDFGHLCALLKTRRHVFVLAAHLLRSTVIGLLKKVNDVLNVSGVAELSTPGVASPISLNLIPSCDKTAADSRRLLVETLHEDILQCILRSSEREILQWQKSGFSVPSALQHVFDAVDNYSLLKVLRGSGGVLKALGSSPEEFYSVLEKVGRHKSCSSDPKSRILTVKHSNGSEVTYSALYGGGFPTLSDSAFEELKQTIFATSEPDCQEVFLLSERETINSNTVFDDIEVIRKHTVSMADPSVMHWWAYDVTAPQGMSFEGVDVERFLIDYRIRPFTMLRRLLPKRFIPCSPSFIAHEFDSLCEKANKMQNNVNSMAEHILVDNDVHYLVAKDFLLLEARNIRRLYSKLENFLRTNITLVQSAARTKLAVLRLTRRVTMLQEAIGNVVKDQIAEDSTYRQKLSVKDLIRVELLNLQEKEQAARSSIRDLCWVEWVAMQTEEQAAAANEIERQIVDRIRSDELIFRQIVKQRERKALDELAARVQERILLQGAHLDGIVATKNQRLQGVQRQLQSARRVHDRRMHMMVSEEEQKADLQQKILKKNLVVKQVEENRHNRAAQLRDATWARQERDKLARMELQRARDSISNRLREKFVMEGIESVVAKRVASEVTEHNKKLREYEEMMMRKERNEREKELRDIEKKQTLNTLRQSKMIDHQLSSRDAARSQELYRQWTAQEKERQAVINMKKEEERQGKKLTAALLQAHGLLSNPHVFDSNGHIKSVSRSKSRFQDPGFELANGSVSYSKLLPASTVDSIISFHQQRSPTPFAKGKRDFSPNSNCSL